MRLDGNASLGLLYPVATIILFRALLRRLESPRSTAEDPAMTEAAIEAVRTGAKACCIEAIDFVEVLQRNVWDVLWHSWCRAAFATVSSHLTRLLITSESADKMEEMNNLIGRWGWALRIGSGNLMSLALLRLDRGLIT